MHALRNSMALAAFDYRLCRDEWKEDRNCSLNQIQRHDQSVHPDAGLSTGTRNRRFWLQTTSGMVETVSRALGAAAQRLSVE